MSDKLKICVVGLGYVGLPLAVEFAKQKIPVIGFDISGEKIAKLKKDNDPNQEIPSNVLQKVKIEYTSDATKLKLANFIIVAVPTPINKAKQPDMRMLKNASRLVGQNLTKQSIVVFESTVYPGATEEVCLPIIEKGSGLKLGKDFKLGYSPERINPGDKEHTIGKIVKVVSGSDEKTLELIAKVYSIACKAGVHKAPNIKTAEAAKVIENTQRDLNIALMNELAIIFHKIGINTKDVLDAAGTKWNFHKYTPGLVGGHCIGVDPYYLTYKAEMLGYYPQVILAGRRINDYMSEYVADMMIKGLIKAGKKIEGAKVLVLGLTFKENVADTRNSKIKDTIKKLKEYNIDVYGLDPLLSEQEVKSFRVINVGSLETRVKFDGVILSAMHNAFNHISIFKIKKLANKKLVVIDIKSVLNHVNNNKIIYRDL